MFGSLPKNLLLLTLLLLLPGATIARVTPDVRQCLRIFARVLEHERFIPVSEFLNPARLLTRQRENLQGVDLTRSLNDLARDPRLTAPTLLMASNMRDTLRRHGVEAELVQRDAVYFLRVTNIPRDHWLGRVLAGVRRADEASSLSPMEFEYSPLFDFAGRPSGIYNPVHRRLEVNFHTIGEALSEGRSEVILHELTHHRHSEELNLLARLPVSGQRAPVPIYVGALYPREGASSGLGIYSNFFRLDELPAHRRMLRQYVSGRRRATSMQNILGDQGLAQIPSVRNRLGADETARIRQGATDLQLFGQRIDSSFSRWLEEAGSAQNSSWAYQHFPPTDRRAYTQVQVAMPENLTLAIPVPVEITDEAARRAYIFDFITRARNEGREDAVFAASVLSGLPK